MTARGAAGHRHVGRRDRQVDTHLSSRNPHPGRSGRAVAPSYQCSPSFEPSAAAVIIAGIPIATVASAIARASIMTIPL